MPRGDLKFRSRWAQRCFLAGIATFFGATILLNTYDATRPTITDPAAGRIHPQKYNGHSVYLNTAEQNLERGFYAGTAILLLGAVIFEATARRNFDWQESERLKLK